LVSSRDGALHGQALSVGSEGTLSHWQQSAEIGETSRRTTQNLEEEMKSFALKVQRFLASEDGPTAVEYAVMLALIIVVCLATIQTIGTNANATFQSVADELGGP
jgi:pilus assembly protein Flp/PilA